MPMFKPHLPSSLPYFSWGNMKDTTYSTPHAPCHEPWKIQRFWRAKRKNHVSFIDFVFLDRPVSAILEWKEKTANALQKCASLLVKLPGAKCSGQKLKATKSTNKVLHTSIHGTFRLTTDTSQRQLSQNCIFLHIQFFSCKNVKR